MEESSDFEQQVTQQLMAMSKEHLVEFAIQVCVSAETSKRTAMIKCVKMICAHADEYFDKWSKIAEAEGSCIGDVKASAFDIRHAATPICEHLGMTIPECVKY